MVRLLIFRHAEKEENADFTINYYLSTQGRERAQNIIPSFIAKIGIPDIIYAKSPVFPEWSFRCIETVYLLGLHYGLPIRVIDNLNVLLAELKSYLNTDYIILICWEHRQIPDIVRGLGWNNIMCWSTEPDRYPTDDTDYDTVFDVTNDTLKVVDQRTGTVHKVISRV